MADAAICSAYGCQLIETLGILLKVPRVAIATAQVLFHRFFARQTFDEYDVRDVALACFYLACKVEETRRTWVGVVHVGHSIFMRERGVSGADYVPLDIYSTDPPPAGEYGFLQMKNSLVVHERLVLRELAFRVHVEHPHKYLISYLKVLDGSQQFAQLAWNFANDALRTTACVTFEPECIAVAALFIAAKQLDIKLPDTEPTVWWRLFDVERVQIAEIEFLLERAKLLQPVYIAAAARSSSLAHNN